MYHVMFWNKGVSRSINTKSINISRWQNLTELGVMCGELQSTHQPCAVTPVRQGQSCGHSSGMKWALANVESDSFQVNCTDVCVKITE